MKVGNILNGGVYLESAQALERTLKSLDGQNMVPINVRKVCMNSINLDLL